MTLPSFRVYFVTHHDGHLTGHLMRSLNSPFDGPPQSAYGETEEDVLRLLEAQLMAAELAGEDTRAKYYWSETFEVGHTKVVVHPESAVGNRRVIGQREIPLRLSYAWSKAERGGYRVVLPRFQWWFVLESLDIAGTVLQSAVAGALAGEKAKWLYEFRHEGKEYVKVWTPKWSGSGTQETEADPFEGLDTVRQVADELLLMATKKRLPIAVGRHEDFLPLRSYLLASRPMPLLVVGGAGVGKTVWVQRLARYLLLEKKKGGTVPHIFSTSRDRIVAGQVYLGMWQERCLALVQELSGEQEYLFVGQLSEIARPISDGSSLADIFEDPLRSEQISLIAEATEAEVEALRRTRPSLVEAFHIVRLADPAPEEVPQLLMRYLERRRVPERVTSEGLVRLVRHVGDFIPAQCLPGKAYRALSWLLQELGEQGPPLDPKAVSKFFSTYTGLPVELVADEYSLPAEVIGASLKARVIGQPEACDAAAQVIAKMKAGLHDPERPVGSLFFVGPTGVGKTELAKQMARFLFGAGADRAGDRLIRLDMSEYMLPGSAQRLLEAEAEGGGSLAQRVREQPLCLVLLDEIEKAHPEVFDLLLAMLGEGRMTDTRGRLVDLRMVVFVMTSNLGQSAQAPVGFGGQQGGDELSKVKQHFRPEFFARLDRVVRFGGLSQDHITEVVDLMLTEVAQRSGFGRRDLRIRITNKARERLAELGHHPLRGARPLKRVIEERVVTPIAVLLAEDPNLRGRTLCVTDGDPAKPGELAIVL